VSFIVTLPFPYYFIGSFFSTSSDSEVLYWIALYILLSSITVAILHSKYVKSGNIKLDDVLRVTIAYLLSFFLLKYGVDKLLLQQFYTPKPNILFTPVGEMSKDILFWTSMGTSTSYNWFMALLEIIPGLLLLHSKTRELAALIAFGVLLNVFMVNIGFDISVKLFSIYLLFCSIYLIQPFTSKLIRLLVMKKEIQLATAPKILSSSPLIKRLMKSTVICFFALEISIPYLNQPTQHNEFIGAYKVNSPTLLFGYTLKRIYIHSEDYFIIEDNEGQFHDYNSTITGNYIHLLDQKVGFQIHQNESKTEFREIGFSDGKSISTTRIELSQLPAMQDDFHWTVEGIIGE
jgi:hypothetical protein